MQRCLELAKRGAGNVAPNPMVGSVLVFDDKIIGEGWHKVYGEAHAEVNCIASVQEEDKELITNSTLYVSLEPCAHFGKTPPCVDLIIKNNIPKVVIGCRDPFDQVNGKGIEKLKAAEVYVESGILEKECKELNKRFFTFHEKKRPYIILKWAQTANGKISSDEKDRLHISNQFTNRLVHKWRSEEASILVGTNTAMLDDPELNNRLWEGKSPIRMVLDIDLRLPHHLKIFDRKNKTIIFNAKKHEEIENLIYYKINKSRNIVLEISDALFHMNLQSVLVEGGARLLQSFIEAGLWDEARVITNEKLNIVSGISAPELNGEFEVIKNKDTGDVIRYFANIK